jgi:uncharacterized MAPEG superfamily protein
MTIAYWTVLVAILMPFVLVIIAKAPAALQGKYDNNAPRHFLANLEGYRQRANWAHQNSFEILPAYAAAVIIAHFSGSSQVCIDTLAGIFVFSRIAYAVFYITDLATLRSIAWFIGFACVIGMFVIPM